MPKTRFVHRAPHQQPIGEARLFSMRVREPARKNPANEA